MRRFLSALAVLVVASASSADENPTVRGIIESGQLTLADPLPASTPFKLFIAAPEAQEGELMGGMVVLWNAGGENTCDVPGHRQRQERALVISGSAGDRALTATLGALEIGKTYCIAPQLVRRLNSNEQDAIRAAIADSIETTCWPASAIESQVLKAIREWQRDGVAVKAARDAGAEEVARAASQAIATAEESLKACEAWSLRDTEHKLLLKTASSQQEEFRSAVNKLAGLRPSELAPGTVVTGLSASPPSPRYETIDKVLLRRQAAEIADVAAELRQSGLGPLAEEIEATPSPSQDLLKRAEVAKLKSTIWLPSHDSRVVPAWFNENGISATGLSCTDCLSLMSAELSLLNASREVLETASRLVQMDKGLAGIRDAVAGKKAEVDAARPKMDQMITTALKTTPVSEAMRSELRLTAARSAAGQGTVAAAGSYAAVDTGVAVAVPFLSESQASGPRGPWLVPYLGLDLSLVPVDRTIPVGDLANPSCGSVFRALGCLERLSFTVGIGAAIGTVPGHATSGLVFGGYPVVGLGWRLTDYSRVVGGAVLYQLADGNPASSRRVVSGAPFLALSVDDAVAALVAGKKLP